MNTLRRFSPGSKEQKPTIDSGVNRDADQPAKLRQNVNLIEVLQKIPLFKGLSLLQFKEMLRICGRKSFKEGEYICRLGDDSTEFFILLQGSLKVTLGDEKVISRVEPIGIVGEMGVFTGEKRSANIIASTSCLALTLHRMEIMKLFRMDVDMGVKMLLNVIQELSRKIRRDNMVIQQLRGICTVSSGGASTPEVTDGETYLPEIEKWPDEGKEE